MATKRARARKSGDVRLPAAITRGPYADAVWLLGNALRMAAAQVSGFPAETVMVEIVIDPERRRSAGKAPPH
jgi:hypothetical protein